MLTQLPAFISAVCLSVYWASVVVKLVRLSKKIGKDPNAIPRERLGQLLRIIWYPTVLLWIAQCWGATLQWEISNWVTPLSGSIWIVLGYIGAVIAIITTALTFVCWHKMGRSWRIGIDPNEKTELIITGPYRYVLHPIYSLSLLLAFGTLLTVPSLLMLVTVIIHSSLLCYEAIREEHYLVLQHGEQYLNYKKTVGRFIPRQCPFS